MDKVSDFMPRLAGLNSCTGIFHLCQIHVCTSHMGHQNIHARLDVMQDKHRTPLCLSLTI